MTDFRCEICESVLSDKDHGYLTGCEHYPVYENASVPVNAISMFRWGGMDIVCNQIKWDGRPLFPRIKELK